MKIELKYGPAYTIGLIHLDGGEEVRVEAASMVMMSEGMTLETQATGGLLQSLGRKMFGGESFFQNTFKAPAGGGYVVVAPALTGDVFSIDLHNETMLVQSGSYLAAALSVNIDTKWSGAKTFFASEGFIMLRATGTGPLVLSSYGAIHQMELAAGERITVDTGHLVAFTEGIDFKVSKVGGITSTLFSGEGLVVELTGPGNVLLQTRSSDQFLSWLIPKLPDRTTTVYKASGGKS